MVLILGESDVQWIAKMISVQQDDKTVELHFLRCFDIVFQRPYWYFSTGLKVMFSLSDRSKIFTSD